ncbi:hypothetical protein [Polyangium aurulentum]|uniref:hypothetical protein n=1 Tax=Polyangium aurulentum TaxID=2567896 RepID=UPI0010AEB5AD|nr:hypothetical protein [Polyangium aurulentum]UQA62107.1 hypothetical protein E8A73_017175 [Polyangium aurulentum]
MSDDEERPPASSRKPRSLKDELPLDDGLPGIIDPEAEPLAESEERAPASRKVASQRGTSQDIATWDIEDLAAEAPPTRKANASTPPRRPSPEDVRVVLEREPLTQVPEELRARDLRRGMPERDVVVLASAGRSFRAATFGELLDDALSLGDDD